MKKKTVKPDRICFECLHYEACQSWNIGSLVRTKADNCVNYRASVDVRPVVFGHWVYEEPNGANSFKGAYWCDQCYQPEPYRKNFCPNCGADMRGE